MNESPTAGRFPPPNSAAVKESHPPAVPRDAPIDSGGPAVRLLQIWLSLLLFIPALLTFAPLGAAGSPATIFGVMMATALSISAVSSPASAKRPSSQIAHGVALIAIAVLISYVAASMRPIDPQELTTADRGLVTLTCLLGVFFTASWGLSSFTEVEIVLAWAAHAIGFVSIVGVAQFVSGQTLVDRLSIPGLTPNADFVGVIERVGYSRVAGTATHPIEFGVLLAIGLPLALHHGLYGRSTPTALRWFPLAAIGLGLPLSLSRSAVICVAVVLATLLPSWPRKRASAALVALAGAVAAIYIVLPGLLGPFIAMFNLSQDASAQSRTDSYGYAFELFQRSPFFGRGFLTLLPRYRILDNQYAGTAIELGLVGLLALVATLVISVTVTLRIAQRVESEPLSDLGRSVAAAVAASAVSFGTFDAFAFPQVSQMLFLVVGAGSAFERLARSSHLVDAPDIRSAVNDA